MRTTDRSMLDRFLAKPEVLRIAGFSASSLVTLRLAGLFLENGDEIVQLTFVDHFPMLFASPLHDFNTTPESFEEVITTFILQFPHAP